MNKNIKKITGIGIFMCLVVVLQLFSNYVQFGPVSITLSLIPIVVGSIIYGPFAGFLLGVFCGVIAFLAPSTISVFWPYGIFKTLMICIFKTGIAGLLAGYIFKAISSKKKKIAVILSSISVPIINTGIFAIGSLILYRDLLMSLNTTGQSTLIFLLVGFIGFNFIIEFLVNSVLSPIVYRLVNIFKSNYENDKN